MKTWTTTRLNFLVLPLLAVTGALGLQPVWADTLVVSTTNDSGPGSLRQAIFDNNFGGGNTIIFSNTVTGTIALTSELAISANVTINGPGAKVLTVSGNNATRVFNIIVGVSTISGLKIANGRTSDLDGGGILNQGTLILRDCWIAGNRADNANGGGIANYADLNLFTSAVSGNSVSFTTGGGKGGGIYNRVGAGASVVNSTVSGNSATIGAGGVHNEGDLIINSGTIASNSASGGTGGGGVFNSSFANLVNTIIAGNSSGVGGPDASGGFFSNGYNLVGQTNGSSGWDTLGDQLGSSGSPLDPLLGPLRDNGGQSPTHALQTGSPAIDKGNTGGGTDQRGASRPFDFESVADPANGDGSDTGAFEFGIPVLNIAAPAPTDYRLAWPAAYGDFTLESVTTLGEVNNWTPVTNPPTVVGDQFIVTINTTDATGFFRLRGP